MTQYDLLEKMGAVMNNTGGAVNCGYTTLPSGSLVAGHQVTTVPLVASDRMRVGDRAGPQDFALIYDT